MKCIEIKKTLQAFSFVNCILAGHAIREFRPNYYTCIIGIFKMFFLRRNTQLLLQTQIDTACTELLHAWS